MGKKLTSGNLDHFIIVQFSMFSGINSEEEKNSFDYLRSLKANEKAHLTVDLGQIDLLINAKP